MLSDANSRRIAVDLAKMKNDGLLSESDLALYGDVIGVSLTEHAELQERALELHKKYM
jgi:hypothetical protein